MSDGAARKVALSVSYISFRILTLAGSIYLAMKIAFFDYAALGNSGAAACAVLMIVGSLVALWIESVVPYVLTAARLADADDAQSLVRLVPLQNLLHLRLTLLCAAARRPRQDGSYRRGWRGSPQRQDAGGIGAGRAESGGGMMREQQ